MKNKMLLILLQIGIVKISYSQDTLDSKTFKKVLNEQFSNIVTGQSKNTLGNFASIDLKDGEISFSGIAISKKGRIFGLKGSGGVNDGIFSILNNSSLNTKISLEGQFHLISRKAQMLSWYIDSEDEHQIKKMKLKKNIG